jgi:hypothetical protein
MLDKEERRILVSGLDSCLSTSEYSYNREGSIGIITPNRQVSYKNDQAGLMHLHLQVQLQQGGIHQHHHSQQTGLRSVKETNYSFPDRL